MKQNVLVVDDESQILAALKRTLRNEDFSLLTANDGEEALAVLAENKVDLIISDYMMPGLSGTELLTKAEEMQPDSIRMILSGHSDFQNVMESMKAGTVHKFLAKPWSNNVLISQINNSLAAKKTDNADGTSAKDSDPSKSFYEIHTDLDYVIKSVAPELSQAFGYQAEELIGQNFSTLITERSYQQHLDYVESQNSSEVESYKISAKSRIAQTKEKKPFPISLAVNKTADEIIYFINADQANAPTTKSVAYGTDEAYLLVDQQGKILKFNQKFSDLFGGLVVPKKGEDFAQFLQDSFEQDFYPESQLDPDEWLEAFLDFSEPVECEFQNDQMIVVTPTKHEDGTVTLTHILQDLDIERMLNKALDDAQKAIQEKREVIERINNEITTPMQESVLTPLEKLNETDLEPTQKEHLDLALKSSATILTNLQSITDFTSVHSDK